jgi:hypothetical protein
MLLPVATNKLKAGVASKYADGTCTPVETKGTAFGRRGFDMSDKVEADFQVATLDRYI